MIMVTVGRVTSAVGVPGVGFWVAPRKRGHEDGLACKHKVPRAVTHVALAGAAFAVGVAVGQGAQDPPGCICERCHAAIITAAATAGGGGGGGAAAAAAVRVGTTAAVGQQSVSANLKDKAVKPLRIRPKKKKKKKKDNRDEDDDNYAQHQDSL
jgi:hypothetical protein